MKKTRITLMLVSLIMILSIFALAGCSGNNDAKNGTNTQTEDDANLDADREDGTNDLTDDNDKNGDNNNDVSLTIDTPNEEEAISNSFTVIGKAEGEVKSVKCVITANGTHLGEGTSLVADVSHEYSAKINCTLPDDMERGDDGTVKAELKVTALDSNDKELKTETRTITMK